MDKTTIRSTMQCIALLQNMFNFMVLSSERVISIGQAPSVAAILVAGGFGIGIGMMVHNIVSTATVTVVILFLCIVSSCSLLGGDDLAMTEYLMLGALILAPTVVASRRIKVMWNTQ